MNYLDLIDAERLTFARLATEAARRTGGRTVSNVEVIRCSGGPALICADIGGECVTHGLELPDNAWTPQLESEIERRFRGSLEIAFQQLRSAA